MKFCEKQRSISTAITNFIDWFMDSYSDEKPAERKILAQCVQQMFRKYYYSALDPEMMFTPANIVNTLYGREFGVGLMAVPFLQVVFKGKKIDKLQYHFRSFQIDNHPFSYDLEFLLDLAATGIQMESPGILFASEYSKLKKGIMIFDRHYINILCLISLEAGYIECQQAENNFIGMSTPKAGEFLKLGSEKKLQVIIEAAITLCSKKIIQTFPELQKEFSIERIAGFLRNPKSFERVIVSVYKKMGIDMKQIDWKLFTANFDEVWQSVGFNKENIIKLFWLQNMLGVYFFTPFGYYLQLIQPIYPDIYDLDIELDEILSEIDDFQTVRNKLFSMATEYDLTVLGEKLLVEGNKPRRERKIPSNIGDEEMLQAVLKSADYLEFFEEEELDLDDDGGLFSFPTDRLFETQSGSENGKGKIIQFPKKKANDSENSFNDQVFDFKVKVFYAKRIWRQIEIKGSQSLHDLHEAIFDSFGLEPDHLYAFYLSNKFWDKNTEYAHPAAESRPANRIKLNRLNLNIRQKIAYVYDFGDECRFEVELVAIHDELEKKVEYPREIKRNKPEKTVCDQCQSGKNSIEWYCNDHDCYLCDDCAQDTEHEKCYITKAIL